MIRPFATQAEVSTIRNMPRIGGTLKPGLPPFAVGPAGVYIPAFLFIVSDEFTVQEIGNIYRLTMSDRAFAVPKTRIWLNFDFSFRKTSGPSTTFTMSGRSGADLTDPGSPLIYSNTRDANAGGGPDEFSVTMSDDAPGPIVPGGVRPFDIGAFLVAAAEVQIQATFAKLQIHWRIPPS